MCTIQTVDKGARSSYDMVLLFNDTQVVFDCEARHITFPIRRVYACATYDAAEDVFGIVEEPRPNQYFCHVIRTKNPHEVSECMRVLRSALGRDRLADSV